jgi:hypothetical protein
MPQPVLVQRSAKRAQARLRIIETGSAFADLECVSARGLAAEAVQGVARRVMRKRRAASRRRVGMRAPLEVGSATAPIGREGRSRENVHLENITYSRYRR